jgi:hypothetical protein
MPSKLVDLLLQSLSLAERLEEQRPASPITLAALQHELNDAVAEVESLRNRQQVDRIAE